MAIVMFFFIAALFIISNQNINLTNQESRQEFNEAYMTWLGGIFNKGGEITAFVINSEWLPENE